MEMLEWQEVVIRLVVAAVLGALVGLERERKSWAAGMRTHMMVCVGSCLIMIVSAYGFSEVLGSKFMELDPSRVAAQVVSGIGFLGAGTILFMKEGIVRGLTTAAGLWTVAGIGLAAGGGMYFPAAIATLIVIIILWALQPIEKRYARRFAKQNLRIVMFAGEEETNIISRIMNEEKFEVDNFMLSKSGNENIMNIHFESADSKKLSKLIKKLRKLDSVKEVFWSH